MIVQLENIHKIYNGNAVLKDISLTVEDNDRIGLIGVNGCGKSTLLRILTGQELPDSVLPQEAQVAVNRNASIGFLEQNSGLDRGSTIYEEMRSAFAGLLETADKMHALEEKMALHSSHDTEEYHAVSAEYARLSTYFEANEGYLIDVKIRTVLNGMGFAPDRDGRIISTLSGGEKTRLALCKLLLQNPNLLILDEPTNHLDFKTIQWLEDYLQGYRGALLIVSHDRYFLDKLATSVAEIELGRLVRYKGNYSAFVLQKEMAVARQTKEYEAQQEEIAKLQEYWDRNHARASTAKSAHSRLMALEKMERIEKPVTGIKDAKLRFEYDIVPPKDVLTVQDAELAVGSGDGRKILAEKVSFEVKRGEKVALVGANGTGKSSLLKLIQRKIPLSKGTVEWTKNIRIGYFEQENAQLNPYNTVMDEIHNRYRSMTELEVRSALGSVRLVGENVFKQVGVISGGERAKLCFALLMLERSNVLILDEPTNHLDLATKEVLEKALDAFDGTLIFVSHDRYLLSRIATRILEISDEGVVSHPGGFESYIEEQKRQEQPERAAGEEQQRPVQSEKGQKVYRGKEQRAADAKRKLRIRELEESINAAQAQVNALEAEISRPEVCADYALMQEKCAELDALRAVMSGDTDEWLLLCEEG